MSRLAVAVAALLATSSAARADSLTDEVGLGTTKTTRENPRAGNLSNNLNATFDLSDRWILSTGLSLTLEGATAKAPGSDFGGSASAVAAFSAGLEFDPTESVSLSMDADFSPSSTQTSASQLTYTDSTGKQSTANTQLRSASSNSSVSASIGYDTAGDSNFEWGLNLGVTGTHFSTTQRIIRIQTTNGDLTSQQVIASCDATGTCSRPELRALRATPASLDSAKVSVGGSITAFVDTDLSVTFDYYGYNQDPTQAGYFSLGQVGRGTISGGGGIPIAPLHYLARTEIGQRFGDFSAHVWVTGGHYVNQTGQATRSLGTKLQYKFTKAFRMWASATFQKDTDATGYVTNSGNYAVGVGYRF